jgi:TamB, inner membrane protein subunit of TAM complex
MPKSQPGVPRRSFFRRLVRVLLRTLLTVVIILLIVFFLIQTPFIQNIIRGKAETYLSRKLKTPVRIGDLSIVFFRRVTLKDVYIEDRQRDTLLSAGLIDVQLRMLGLLHHDLDIERIGLGNVTVKIRRQLPDTAFNFQYIVDAFSGPPSTQPATTSGQAMRMSLGELVMDKIRFVYRDTVTGSDMEVWVGHSLAKIDGIDLDHLRFGIPTFEAEGVRGRISQRQSLGGAPAASVDVGLLLGRLVANVQRLDVDKEIIQVKDFQLDSTSTAVRLGTTPKGAEGAKGAGAAGGSRMGTIAAAKANLAAAATDTLGWRVLAGSVRLNGDNVQFDDDNQPRQKDGMDYAHLGVSRLTLAASNLDYSADSISGSIAQGRLTEQSGFRLLRLQTKFFYSDHRALLSNLLLQTPGTLLQRNASLQYASLAGMMKDPARTLVDVDLPGSRVQVKDILTFAPFLRKQPLFSHPNEVWQVNARVKGNFDALTIPVLQVSGVQDLRVDVAGKVLHPFDIRRIQTGLQIRHISGSRAALVSLLPPGTLPKGITLPNHFDLMGRLNGGMDAMQPDLVLQTSSGTILLKGWARNMRSATAATYDLDLKTRALQLGYILQDSLQWGAVTADLTVKGQGLDLHSANATFSGRVASATIHRYTYTDFSFDGSMANQQARLQAAINDKAVHFELHATADLTHKFPALQLDWQIDTLDLYALHFVKDTMQFKGHIGADFSDTNPDSLQGTFKATGLRLLQGRQWLTTDSIVLVAARQGGIEDIGLHTEMADLDWKGRYKLTETVQALQHTIDSYYRLGGGGSSGTNRGVDSAFTPQDWTMSLHLRPSPLVLTYMPSLKGTDSLGVLVSFNSAQNDLHLHLATPHVQYGSQVFDNPDLTVGTGGGRLNYDLRIDGGTGSGFELHRSWVAGSLQHDQLTTALVLEDTKGKERYRLAGQIDQLPGGLKFVFNPDSLLLNYDAWQVSRDNYLQYDSAGVNIHDFVINHSNDTLSIRSQSSSPASPIDIRFANFSLGTLSRFADQDSLLVDGTINGTAEIKNVMTHPVFTSDLQIRKLSYQTDTLGDLAVKVNNEKDSALIADISLEGNSNDIKLKGDYYTGSGRMNLQLNLGQLNLAAFDRVAKDNIESMKGYLKGNLAITGTLDKPLLKGNLHFDSSLITPVVSGEPLKLSKDNIGFDEDGFNFSQFALEDSAGNRLVIDGNVYTHDYRDFKFDISVNATNFRLVNAPEENTRQFYGSLNLDAAVNLEGDLTSPKVDGDIKVNRKTNFYFVLPGNDPEVVGREGVIRFVDHNNPTDTLVDKVALLAKARQSTITGADVSLSLQTDSNAVFTVVIDPRSGDVLTARGRSTLAFGMDKSGKTTLTGSYEVSSGSYNLSFSVLKRSFAIQRGSVITWTGDPLTATLDLTAIYTATTPSFNLVQNEIVSLPSADQNKFKEKLPFFITLKMSGELMKPTITFDISLPPNILTLWPDVDQRLQQIRGEESELNKQVFALLLLNQFVGEDPVESVTGSGTGNSSGVGNLAFQSASQILTNQLDQLAGSLIKGVNIHFDLNNVQDFSTGTEFDYTELDVAVSKKLFNERVEVSVGSNFDVMGVGPANQSPSNLAGDVSVDYKLSKDGRYRLRAYRQNQYDEIVEGQVVETGLSFILTLDYNSLKELFQRSAESKLQERTTLKPVSATSSNQ